MKLLLNLKLNNKIIYIRKFVRYSLNKNQKSVIQMKISNIENYLCHLNHFIS